LLQSSRHPSKFPCEYSLAVKDAKKDIDRLQRTDIDNLGVLGGVKLLFEKHDTTRPPTTHNLLSSLEECHHQLQSLKAQLEPRKTQKFMSSLGLRSFQLQSGLSGRNIYRSMLGLHMKSIAKTPPDGNPNDKTSRELLVTLASRQLTRDDIINDSGELAHTFNGFPNGLRSPLRWLSHQLTVGISLRDIQELPTLRQCGGITQMDI
jgi:hypothetical protein